MSSGGQAMQKQGSLHSKLEGAIGFSLTPSLSRVIRLSAASRVYRVYAATISTFDSRVMTDLIRLKSRCIAKLLRPGTSLTSHP
jgi:hypothetical protein